MMGKWTSKSDSAWGRVYGTLCVNVFFLLIFVKFAIFAQKVGEKKISKFDGLILLQPTSPFRKKGSIEKAIKLFKQNINKTVIGFSPLRSKELGALFFLNKRSKKVIKPSSSANLLKLNGSIYLSSPKNIRKYKSFFKPHILPLIQTSKEESIDYNEILIV